MRKSTQAFFFESLLVPSLYRNHHSKPSRSFISSISSSFTFNHNRFCSTTPELDSDNPALASYLIGSLKFSRDRALSVCSSFARTKSLENPKEVVHFLKGLDISDAQIKSIAHRAPWILFADVEKILKPKVTFFQDLGLSGPILCSLISGNPYILHYSLRKSLTPCMQFIHKILISDGRYKSKEQVNDVLVRILTRCNSIVGMMPRFKANVHYLESCGVTRSQLSSLLVRHTMILSWPEEKLQEIVSRALDMKFTMGSGMLAHAIQVLSCLSNKTLNGRYEVFRTFGFSEDEIAAMFRSMPRTFGLGEENLRCKLEFFLNTLKVDKLVLVKNPQLLTLSLHGRLIPRSKVFEILKSRMLLNEDFGFTWAMCISNQKFLQKFILPFQDDTDDLLMEAYKGKLVDTSEN